MSKRGQATIIIFLALVILVIIGLIFFVKSKVYIGGTDIENLRGELDPIIRHVEKCLYDTTTETAFSLGQHGGYTDPQEKSYRLWEDQKISYLCYNRPKVDACSNRYLKLSDIESQLKDVINSKLDTCLQIKSFEKRGFTLLLGEKDLEIDIGSDSIISTFTQSVKIRKGESEAEISVFSKAVPIPLGRLHSAAIDIINAESMIGKFNTLIYSLIKSKTTNKPYVIERLKPYPDKLYILKIKNTPSENNEFVFQFFVEGESRWE